MGELTHFSLFTGIGGIDLAAEWAGFKTVGQCEINPFARQILSLRWPDVKCWEDVRNVGRDTCETVDLISGGFPCQDLSVAGKQAGLEGERSGLWFEMLRVIGELRPRWVLAENVRGAVNLALDTVKMGMEEEGYKVWPFVIPASAFGAPHRRERLFVVGCREDVADAYSARDRTPGNRTNRDRQKENEGREEQPQSQFSGYGEVGGVMWATPNCMDVLPSRSFDAMKRQATNGARKNRSRPGNLREQVDPLMHLAYIEASLEANGVPKEQWEEHIKGRMERLWPTPRAGSHTSPCIHGEGGLDIQTAVKLWPTPAAQDGKNSTLPQSQKERDTIPGAVIKQGQEGQLNPDWVECLMGFPIGWTNPDCDEPKPWPGWPASMGAKMWGTHTATGTVRSQKFIRDSVTPAEFVALGMEAGQFPFEPPRVARGIKNRANRIKCLGNAVVPQQVLSPIQAIYYMETI